jgi:hypothetical protein
MGFMRPILAGYAQVVSIFLTLPYAPQPSCLGQHETDAHLKRQMKFVRQYSDGAAIALFALVVFVLLRYAPKSSSRIVDIPIGLALAWASLVAIYCLTLTIGVLLIRCPRCGWRFAGNPWAWCRLPNSPMNRGKVA